MTLLFLGALSLLCYFIGLYVGHWSREDEAKKHRAEIDRLRSSRDRWRATAIWATETIEGSLPGVSVQTIRVEDSTAEKPGDVISHVGLFTHDPARKDTP